MNPIQHKTSNDVLHPPGGMSSAECKPLYVTRVVYDRMVNGLPPFHGVVSYWQPTPEQLDLLNQGRPVFLFCLGFTHPPVSIGVEGDGRL